VSGRPVRAARGPLLLASALLALILSCAATSVARADAPDAARLSARFARQLVPEAPLASTHDSVSAVAIEVSAQATQDEPVTITVLGESETTSALFVYVSTNNGCATQPDGNGGTELSGAGGDPLGVGYFEESYKFTPASVATYTVCAYVDEAEADPPSAVAEETFVAARPTASALVRISANPTQDVPVTITVSGESEVARKLFVYVSTASTCGADPADEAATELSSAGGEAIAAGTFEQSYKFTPASVATYTVCAYVDEAAGATPDATGDNSFAAALPTASLSIRVSADATQDVPATITVSGESEVARKLFVYVSTASGCPSEPAGDGGTELSSAAGEAVGAGTFETSYKFTPASVATYTVCAYVDEAAGAVPDAVGDHSFVVVSPTFSLSMEVSAEATQDVPATITVSGESEVARRLFVYVGTHDLCEADPAGNVGAAPLSSGGEAIAAGDFKKSYSYTPGGATAYTVCAYVDESEGAPPDATGILTFTSVTLQEIAEAEERAGLVKAEEERTANEAAEAQAGAAQQAAARAAQEAAARAAQEAAAKAAQEAATKAAEAGLKAALAARIKAARERPVARLEVKPLARNGHTSAHPGYTTLDVTTSPYAFVTVELTRFRRKTMQIEWGEHPTAAAEEIPWSCRSPGGTYRYTVTARTDVGKKLVRSGSFAPASPGRCHALQRDEADSSERGQDQAKERSAREYEQEVIKKDAAERERQEREEEACRQNGGTPTIVLLPAGPPWICEAPAGETL